MIDNFFAKVDVQLPPTPPQSRVRQEFFAYPGTAVPRLSPADVLRIFSRFAAVCPYPVITPDAPGDEAFLVTAEFGRVKLVRFTADLTTDPAELARRRGRRFAAILYGVAGLLAVALILLVVFVPAFPEVLVRVVRAGAAAITAFGVAGGVSSLIASAVLTVVDPVIPVVDYPLEDMGLEARRRWVAAQRHIITLGVAYARDEQAADSEWRADWQEALRHAKIAAQLLRVEQVLSPVEHDCLLWHYDTMAAWPSLYCRDFARN